MALLRNAQIVDSKPSVTKNLPPSYIKELNGKDVRPPMRRKQLETAYYDDMARIQPLLEAFIKRTLGDSVKVDATFWVTNFIRLDKGEKDFSAMINLMNELSKIYKVIKKKIVQGTFKQNLQGEWSDERHLWERVIDNLIGLVDDKDDYVLRSVNEALSKLGLSLLDIKERKKELELKKAKSYIDEYDISLEASGENLRKYLVSGENTLILEGLTIMFDEGVPSELMGLILGLYMWSDDKDVRALARKIFFNDAPEEIKELVKTTWKTSYRNIKSIDLIESSL